MNKHQGWGLLGFLMGCFAVIIAVISLAKGNGGWLLLLFGLAIGWYGMQIDAGDMQDDG